MWLHPVSIKKNVQTYILPKLCLTAEIKSKYFRTGECVGIGQTTVHLCIFCTVSQNLIIALYSAFFILEFEQHDNVISLFFRQQTDIDDTGIC